MCGGPETEIVAAIDEFLDHVANRRLEETLRCFTGDADCAIYGSEEGEEAIGPAALRSFFEGIYARSGPRFAFGIPRLSISGDVAWFTSEGSVSLGGEVIAPYRLTGILVRRHGRWFWALFSGSEPLPPRG